MLGSLTVPLPIHPFLGYNVIHGKLNSLKIKVQRQRVRQAVKSIDPAGVASRGRRSLKRRKYKVRYPMSLWHMDSNHKLIRFALCRHYKVFRFVGRVICALALGTRNLDFKSLAGYFRHRVANGSPPF